MCSRHDRLCLVLISLLFVYVAFIAFGYYVVIPTKDNTNICSVMEFNYNNSSKTVMFQTLPNHSLNYIYQDESFRRFKNSQSEYSVDVSQLNIGERITIRFGVINKIQNQNIETDFVILRQDIQTLIIDLYPNGLKGMCISNYYSY